MQEIPNKVRRGSNLSGFEIKSNSRLRLKDKWSWCSKGWLYALIINNTKEIWWDTVSNRRGVVFIWEWCHIDNWYIRRNISLVR